MLKIGMISLGCDKNRIDSEILLGNLKTKHTIVADPIEADILIVNTCGFIESSKQESIDTIFEMAEYKSKHNCKVLIVTGCLTQRYKSELMELIPEIDIMLGVNDYDKIDECISNYLESNTKQVYCNYSDASINEGQRILTTPKSTAYLRIAEGCDNFCTYCIIPKIRGKYRSRTFENIIAEAEGLVTNGVKEIIIVAQDTTRYGLDLYGTKRLHELIRRISLIKGIEWIRLLYCYPEEIYPELIEEIASNAKVCHYIDMPIQHISDNILKRMGRRGRKKDILDTIDLLRSRVPDIALRTSIIVGFPGETQEDFEELKDFVNKTKFDKLGVFKYSQEEDTPAAVMPDQVSDEVKEDREKELMLLQMDISKEINNSKVGKVYTVFVENTDGDYWCGRNYEMSPEIDGAIYFKCDKILNKGDFILVKISEATEYDLIGVVCYESCQ
jgi:ribosomal protein S12 methylthiotransferase